MSESTYSLRHDNFESQIPNSIRKLRDDESFTDVTLVSSKGDSIKAHQVILASTSRFFKKVLTENPHKTPMIHLSNVEHNTLLRIKDFIYCGQAQILTDSLEDFVEVGGMLGIEGLIESNEATQKDNHMLVQDLDMSVDEDDNIKDMTTEAEEKIIKDSADTSGKSPQRTLRRI